MEKPVTHVLLDGGANDEELIRMNMMVSSIGGVDPIGAKGVASMELTIGSKMHATIFFIS